jgi:hypothetical protein
MLAGPGLVGDLQASVDSRFVELGRGVAVPGAIRATNRGFSIFGLEPVEAVGDAAVVADRNDDGTVCGITSSCATVTAVLGARGDVHGPLGAAAQDGARGLFDAMTRARETVSGGARVRTTERGLVTCTEHTTTPPSYECTIGNVESITPSSRPVFDRPICGLIACRTTLVRMKMGVIADVARAVSPELSNPELAIPTVLVGQVGMGTETLTMVAGLRVADDELLARPKSPLTGTFGGRRVGDGPGTAGFRAAQALYDAMSRVPEVQDPMTLAVSRRSPNGRVLCTQQRNSMDGGVFYGCQLTDIHRFGPAESPQAGSTVCGAPSPLDPDR